MDTVFRFVRHSCNGGYDVYVALHAVTAAAHTSAFGAGVEDSLNLEQREAVLAGVASAIHSSGAAPLQVLVTAARAVPGKSGPLGFKICAEAAMNLLLGHPEKAPAPGVLLGEA